MKVFLTQKMREAQTKISLMKSIHRTSNALIFSQMREKIFFSEKKNSEIIDTIHVNIRSLSKNFDSHLDILRDSSYGFNVLCITEIWCTDSTFKNNTNLYLPNIDIISQERKNKQTRRWCANLHPQKPDMQFTQ